ncbi:hypothetical protein B0H12DRAFT_1240726 [Mycena haematopus]|nr:hypothetical protein B0H12DRAFT_1240726 [Mycena haematopus]
MFSRRSLGPSLTACANVVPPASRVQQKTVRKGCSEVGFCFDQLGAAGLSKAAGPASAAQPANIKTVPPPPPKPSKAPRQPALHPAAVVRRTRPVIGLTSRQFEAALSGPGVASAAGSVAGPGTEQRKSRREHKRERATAAATAAGSEEGGPTGSAGPSGNAPPPQGPKTARKQRGGAEVRVPSVQRAADPTTVPVVAPVIVHRIDNDVMVPPQAGVIPVNFAAANARAGPPHGGGRGEWGVVALLLTMGLPNFWQLVQLASQNVSFKELCIQEGFIVNRREIGTMLVGVDANLWLAQCQMMFHKPNHAQKGRNPELRALFHKLVALHQVGVAAVFVFDGSNRPSVKRDKQVKAKPHWLVEEFTELIDLFGFHHYTAPGEADAELAYLNRFEYIDAVFSDDGDVALFGARRIFRRLNKKNLDEITVYTSDALQTTAGIELTQGGILLLAIMSGGDYDTVGLAECGIEYGEQDLRHFLVGWREEIRMELVTNSHGYLGRKYRALADKITGAFPNLPALRLYACPITSWSEAFTPPVADSWNVKLPDLPVLAKYCMEKFGWSALDLVGRFKQSIFPGLFIRRLTKPLNPTQQIQDHVVKGRIDEERPHLSTYLNIVKVDNNGTYKKYQVKLAVGALAEWTLSKIDARASAAGSPGAVMIEWIPASLVERCIPLMVNAFNHALNLPLVPLLPAEAAGTGGFLRDSRERPPRKPWCVSGGSKFAKVIPRKRKVIDLTRDSEDEFYNEIIDLT